MSISLKENYFKCTLYYNDNTIRTSRLRKISYKETKRKTICDISTHTKLVFIGKTYVIAAIELITACKCIYARTTTQFKPDDHGKFRTHSRPTLTAPVYDILVFAGKAPVNCQ